MKLGSFSVILNADEYLKNNIKPPNLEKKESYYYKITQIKKIHNGEELYLDFLNKENDYLAKLYKDTKSNINKDDKIIAYIKENITKCEDYDINQIFKNNILTDYKLLGYFVENVGNIDLFDSLSDLLDLKINIWSVDTVNRFNLFATQMCKCLKYLQSHNMGHFDIKPENIVYNYNNSLSFGKRFKLIDFGFADHYPFTKFTSKVYGTLDYVPIHFKDTKNQRWKVNDNPNDWFYNSVQKKYIHYTTKNNNYELIYKSDVYSMGIVFNQLKYYIEDHFNTLNIESGNLNHIKILTNKMTHPNILDRYYANECIDYLDDTNELDKNDPKDNNSCLCIKKCLKN